MGSAAGSGVVVEVDSEIAAAEAFLVVALLYLLRVLGVDFGAEATARVVLELETGLGGDSKVRNSTGSAKRELRSSA